MKQVYILLKRIHDPYGCLEDNESDIVGVFDNLELAEQNKIKKQQENAENQKSIYSINFEYWIDNYNINEIYE